jgi:alpha-1,3-mannosyl-glycoprotein beta-1,2-N-acetylglucosaminyltransferase
MIVFAWFIGFIVVFQIKVMPTKIVDTTTNNLNNNNNNNNALVFDEKADYDSPLLIFTCKRAQYLQETLDYIYESISYFNSGESCKFGCPIIISEDGQHDEIRQVVLEYKNKFETSKRIPVIHIHHNQQQSSSSQSQQQQQSSSSSHYLRTKKDPYEGYKALAVHYGWALSKVFNGLYSTEQQHFPIPQRVIILEEDIKVSPDFFSYMEATSHILDSDPSLYAVSAFNDNGHLVKDPTRLLRSDFFPGLGWMMTRQLWTTELETKWPTGFWDDWIRDPQQRKQRQVIRPEISRTYHFGRKGGASNNQFGTILESVRLNDQPVNWQQQDLSYLEEYIYKENYFALVANSQQATTLTDAIELVKDGNVRLEYTDYNDFKIIAKELRIMDDEKAMVPRTAYHGIVETRPHGDYLLFLAPQYGNVPYKR